MTNTKSTKRALLSSVLALFLCFSMLLGTTFAWFTDSVTSGSNVIQTGKLVVDLVNEAGNSMAGEIIEFVAKDGSAQNEILWEPGCTYETEPVYVVNKGNLALKYQIVINGIDGNAKLLEAIEWTVTVNGTATALADLNGHLTAGEKSAAIVLSGHMKEDAGNEYQNLIASGISISVLATQYTSEEDSFNDKYDAEAEYAAQTMLKNVAAVAAGESATVKLESDGYVKLTSDALVGAVVKGDVTLDLNGKTLFVKAEDVDGHQSLFNIAKGGKLTVTGNGTINMVSGKNESKVTAIFNNTSGTLVIENGTYKMDVKTYAQGSLIPTIIDNNGNNSGATTTINGGNFYHTRNMFRNFPSNNGITKLTINGGTFNGEANDWAAIWNQKASSSTKEGQSLIEINGGEFNYVEISNEFETGVTIKDGVVVPVPVSNVDELKAALANGGNFALVADINADNVVTLADIPAGVSAELDLNGHNITSSLNGSAGWSQIFHIGKGASLTINGEGNVHAVSYPTTSYGSVIFNNDAGTLVINGGTYTMEYGTYADGYLLPAIVDTNSNIGKATTIINGGTFYHNRNMFRNFAQPQRGENNATLIINGGIFNGEADDYASIWNQKTNGQGVVGDGVVELNGGTFNYIDITNDFQDDTCIKIDPSITNVTINH